MTKWQVQEAKSRFSELLDDAEKKGPQIITRHGAERAVVLSIEEYKKLAKPESKPTFLEHLLSGPKVDDFKVRRSKSTGRRINL